MTSGPSGEIGTTLGGNEQKGAFLNAFEEGPLRRAAPHRTERTASNGDKDNGVRRLPDANLIRRNDIGHNSVLIQLAKVECR